jgi:hypothetical protein
MSFRIVWPGKFGKQTSQLIDQLERACLIADALALHMKQQVRVIDAATGRVVFVTPKGPATAPTVSHTDSAPKAPSSPNSK